MTSKKLPRQPLKLAILASLALGGCLTTATPAFRAEVAQRIAAPAWMIKRQIPAAPYAITVYERIHDQGGKANVYIEGDGDYWSSPHEWKLDPTPQNPVALHLASKDKAENVIYIARPCQFSGMLDREAKCPPAIWNEARYSQEAVNAISTALDEISARYNLKGVNLIGYGGGAAIASTLSAQRSDVLSLRTVAGTLDHKMQTSINGVPDFSTSLNPVTMTEKLSRIPQYHFIGGQDQYTPPAILNSYLQHMPPTRCVQHDLIQEAEHEAGWVDKWPDLLKRPVTCYNQSMDYSTENITLDQSAIPTKPEHIFTIPENPAKP